jgi:hypothetical protein
MIVGMSSPNGGDWRSLNLRVARNQRQAVRQCCSGNNSVREVVDDGTRDLRQGASDSKIYGEQFQRDRCVCNCGHQIVVSRRGQSVLLDEVANFNDGNDGDVMTSPAWAEPESALSAALDSWLGSNKYQTTACVSARTALTGCYLLGRSRGKPAHASRRAWAMS